MQLWCEFDFLLPAVEQESTFDSTLTMGSDSVTLPGMSPLPLSFYNRCTVDVARDLLGQRLVFQATPNSPKLSAMIVETEAYLGLEDPACHSFHGRRGGRAETLYLAGGHSYIYLIYGLYHCLNAVTGSHGDPEAVLIRAAEPLDGLEVMQRNRPKAQKLTDLLKGPGRLCQAFSLTREQNAQSLTQLPLMITEFRHISDTQIHATSRIGIESSGDAAHWPLRFALANSAFVSGPRLQEF